MTGRAGSRQSRRSASGRSQEPASSPLGELLASGRLGELGAARLYRTVFAVAVAHGYPPPVGRERWDNESVIEVAHSFLADTRTPQRLTHLAVHSVDDEGFDRLLHRMVLNFLRDGGRRTETGRLMLRLRDVLARGDDFVAEAGDRWRLASQPARPSVVPPTALVEAAAAESHVDVPRWSAQTRRQPPAADAPSLERLCRRVLEAAAGTVALDELAKSIAPRLGLMPAPLAHTVDDRDPLDTVAAPHHADAVIDRMRAREIFAILGQRERLLLATAGTPVRQLRPLIGLGPSQAAELLARLRALLAVELRDDDSYEAVFFHLIDEAKAWAAERSTGRPGAIQRLAETT